LLNDTTNVSKLLKTTVMHSDILPIFAYQVLFSAVYSSCIVNNFFYKTSTWVFWKTCWNTFWSKATSWYEYWSPYASTPGDPLLYQLLLFISPVSWKHYHLK